ncbi:MAG: hypothetical protein HOO04_09965 [Phycisphaerae bacterium]|nr:hypothetical protein [Phycisphaerae bacterium]MBT5381737.1 hypothetical protein [Phycisphaerae bacterium]
MTSTNNPFVKMPLLSCCILAIAHATLDAAAVAGTRRFTYLRDVNVQTPGSIEFEHWTTVKWDKPGTEGYWRLDFREEIEFGITDNFQLALYVADWRVKHNSDAAGTEWQYRDTAIEAKWKLSDPTTDFLGVGLYAETKFGPEKLAAEGKLLLQKNLDKLQLLYNLTVEGEWEEEHYVEAKGKIKNQFGASWQLSESFFVGAELLVNTTLPSWRSSDATTNVYLGPALAYHGDGWFIAATLEFLMNPDNSNSERYQFRTIVGFDF